VAVKTFRLPIQQSAWAEDQLNRFLRENRILAVNREWVAMGENSFWAVWIEYLEVPFRAGSSRSTTQTTLLGSDQDLQPEHIHHFKKWLCPAYAIWIWCGDKWQLDKATAGGEELQAVQPDFNGEYEGQHVKTEILVP